jgi:hypothetical protein
MLRRQFGRRAYDQAAPAMTDKRDRFRLSSAQVGNLFAPEIETAGCSSGAILSHARQFRHQNAEPRLL